MAPSFDCASSLLCAEDNISILGWDDETVDETSRHQQNHISTGSLITDFPLQTDECLAVLIAKEGQYLPQEDYISRLRKGVIDVSIRRDAVAWIWKVHAHYGFGPLSAYLSVNYLDRFLSAYELPQGKAWMMQLLSVACLSIAAKMEETDVPQSLDLQVGEAKFVFEACTIQRMELLVLSTLKWKMQSVTPFSFIDYFLHRINDDTPPLRMLIERSIELILRTIRGIDFLEFRPSELAAAVAISVSEETQTVDFKKAVACCLHVEKERVQKCYELIQDIILIRNQRSAVNRTISESVSTIPQSPIGVLDAACYSYKSEDTTVGSCANSLESPASKRRKINRVGEGT